jgi:TRAP-type mannitol/chloroaromatic compound transport system substrate-binding protein
VGGWFKDEVNSLKDLENKTMRIPGLGSKVMEKMGMSIYRDVASVSIDTAINAFKFGPIDAFEWTSPHDDMALDLHKIAKFYYYPGWWEPSTTFDVQVNIDKWNDLPDNYKEIFKSACHETYMNTLVEYDYKNSIALKKLPEHIKLCRFNEDIIKTAENITTNMLNGYAKNNKLFRKVYREWRDFRDNIREWSKYQNKM